FVRVSSRTGPFLADEARLDRSSCSRMVEVGESVIRKSLIRRLRDGKRTAVAIRGSKQISGAHRKLLRHLDAMNMFAGKPVITEDSRLPRSHGLAAGIL